MVLMVFLSCEQLAAHLDGDLAGQVAVRDGGRHLGDVAHLVGQVRRHQVDVVGQLLPRAGRRRAPRPGRRACPRRRRRARRASPRRRTTHSWSTIVLMVFLSSSSSPRTSTVILRVRSPRAIAVATCGDVAHLVGQVRRHLVDVVGQLLPGAAHALDRGLAAELALGAHLARDARHLVGERATADRPCVDGVLQLEDLAARVDDDLLLQVALRRWRSRPARCCAPDRSGSSAIELTASVRWRQVPEHAAHVGLTAELALDADLAREARHLVGERADS